MASKVGRPGTNRKYWFRNTPAGDCFVCLFDSTRPWGQPTYSVHIPSFETVDGERTINTTGRAGARELLGHVAAQLGRDDLSLWLLYAV